MSAATAMSEAGRRAPRRAPTRSRSPVHLPEHRVERAEDDDEVGQRVPDARAAEAARGCRTPASGPSCGTAARSPSETRYTPSEPRARLDVVVRLADVRGEQPRQALGLDRRRRASARRLLDDLGRLVALEQPDPAPVVGVAVVADDDVELHARVHRVRRRCLRRSQFTPLPRAVGPDAPHATASSAESTPTPLRRPRAMMLPKNSLSISSSARARLAGERQDPVDPALGHVAARRRPDARSCR